MSAIGIAIGCLLSFGIGVLVGVVIDRIIQEHEEEKANKYNCKNCIHYGNFEAFYGEVYACELHECHYKRKEASK